MLVTGQDVTLDGRYLIRFTRATIERQLSLYYGTGPQLRNISLLTEERRLRFPRNIRNMSNEHSFSGGSYSGYITLQSYSSSNLCSTAVPTPIQLEPPDFCRFLSAGRLYWRDLGPASIQTIRMNTLQGDGALLLLWHSPLPISADCRSVPKGSGWAEAVDLRSLVALPMLRPIDCVLEELRRLLVVLP